MVIDDLGRTFGSLRISLTDLCNLACTYCTADASKLSVKQIATDAKGRRYLEQVRALHEICHFKEVRLTGGEPLLFHGIEVLVAELRRIGIPKVKLTTNGILLGPKAKLLQAAGLENVNVSLDALDADVFRAMARNDKLAQVLRGIDTAQQCGLRPKINTVVMRGSNEQEVVPLFRYFRQRAIPIRYLEFMQMGHLHAHYEQYFFPQEAILGLLRAETTFEALPRPSSSTANYWRTPEGYEFGIIANTSRPFCTDCDRLRIGSDGKVYGCLSNEQGLAFDPATYSRQQTVELLQQALGMKQRLEFKGSELSMKFIGG